MEPGIDIIGASLSMWWSWRCVLGRKEAGVRTGQT